MKWLRTSIIAGLITIIGYSCVYDTLVYPAESLVLNLRWVKSYPDESIDDVTTGLTWHLSFLGAMLPRGSFENSVTWTSERTFSIDLSKVGFNVKAQQALREILNVLRSSEEYEKFNAIDVGRFMVLTLNSSYHYYAITGAEATLSQIQNKFSFESKMFPVTSSSIAYGHRLIRIPAKVKAWSDILFYASEGEGRIDDGTFVEREYEVLTLMPNGQLRFALYDLDGNLKASASPDLTSAGKPAKCLWCHEVNLQILHTVNEELVGYFTPEEFVSKIEALNIVINSYRNTLNSDLDFKKSHEHAKMELLYIGFMEPSAYRLSQEWGRSVSEVIEKTRDFERHHHHEFSFLGELYNRVDIDRLAPYVTLQVPDDAREFSLYEPRFIHP